MLKKNLFLLPYLLIITLFIGLYFTPLNLGLWGSRDIPDHATHLTLQRTDAQEFFTAGLNVANGQGFIGFDNEPIITRGPGYILILALFLKLFGNNLFGYFSIQLFQLGLLLGSLYLLQKLMQKLEFSEKQIFRFGLLFSLYLPNYIYAYQAIAEITMLFCFIALLYTLLHNNLKIIIPLFALLITIKSTFIVLPAFWYITQIFTTKKYFENLKHCLIVYLLSLLLLSPWIYRNYKQFDMFIISAVGMGNVIYPGNNLTYDGDWQGHHDPYFAKIHTQYTEVEADRILTRTALEQMRAQPLGTGLLWVKKAWRYWSVPIGYETIAAKQKHAALLFLVLHWAILLSGLAGILTLRNNKYMPGIVLVCAVYYGLHIVTYAIPRYHYLLWPFILVFCTSGFRYNRHNG